MSKMFPAQAVILLVSQFLLVVFITLPIVRGRTCDGCHGCCLNTTEVTAACKCDDLCQVFGDCCRGNFSFPNSPTPLPWLEEGINLQCRSVFTSSDTQVVGENEAFLMVSSCPASWLDPENGAVEGNCTISSPQSLPPVTDISTGLVYKNEYCAHCNGVRSFISWSFEFVCSDIVHELFRSSNLSMAISNDPDILIQECAACSYSPPNITKSGALLPRSCIPRIETCLSRSELEIRTNKTILEGNYINLIRQCQLGPLDPVESLESGQLYRNIDCAACNGFSGSCFRLFTETDSQECGSLGLEQGAGLPSFSFTITLQNLGNNQISLSSSGQSTSLTITCPEGEVLIGAQCRPTECPGGYSRTGGRCTYIVTPPNSASGSFHHLNSTTLSCSKNITIMENEAYMDLDNDLIFLNETGMIVQVLDYDSMGRPIICQQNGTAFINCTSALVVLNESEYTVLKNGSILFEGTTFVVILRDEFGRAFICPDSMNSTVNNMLNGLLAQLPGIQELTYVGCSLSVLGAVAVILTYSIFSELQTFPGLVLMNLCVTVSATSLLFIIGGPVLYYHPLKEVCTTLAIVLHYFYLSQFSWMSIFSFEMAKTFYQARKLLLDSKQAKRYYLVIYLFIGWVLPLLITAIAITVNFTTNGLVLYGINSEGQIAGCWINHYQSFIIAFVVPVVLSLSINFFLFVITTILLCKAYKDQSKVDKSNIFTMARVWLAVFIITGLTWIFGFLALLEEINWIWYLFVIFNSTQGFSIFLAFIFTKKIFNLYKMLLVRKLKGRFSISQQTKMSSSTLKSGEDNFKEGNVQSVSFKLKPIEMHELKVEENTESVDNNTP